jgi:cytochrome c-type biogenesis protein CcmH/NrfG
MTFLYLTIVPDHIFGVANNICIPPLPRGRLRKQSNHQAQQTNYLTAVSASLRLHLPQHARDIGHFPMLGQTSIGDTVELHGFGSHDPARRLQPGKGTRMSAR